MIFKTCSKGLSDSNCKWLNEVIYTDTNPQPAIQQILHFISQGWFESGSYQDDKDHFCKHRGL